MTVGLSPKAVLAAILPTLGGVLAVVVQWLATGEFDRAEFATAVAAVGAAALAFVGAYLAPPGEVVQIVGPPQDALLDTAAGDAAGEPAPFPR